jgi:MYXO-CTERM domain-containing protein
VGGSATSDILPLPGINLLVAGGSAGVLSYETSANRLISWLNDDEGVDSATALALDLSGGVFLVADGSASQFLRYVASTSTGLPSGDVVDTLSYPSAGGDVTEFGVIDGYVIAGTSGGDIWVLTDRPWVEADSPKPKAALSGTEVSIDFVVDVDGTWKARLNGEDNEDGSVLASGKVTAGEVATATFTVSDGFLEGDNRIRIVVTSDDGAQGHDTSVLSVDNPPSRVSLRSSHVGWGDQQVEVRIPGISDEDLVQYEVFVTTRDFSDEEYTTGGPGFEGAPGDVGANRLNLPRTVSAEPGQDMQLTIAPLTNGVTYYVAVRATDEAGMEGEMSKVVSVMPRETYGAADLAGEKGGLNCSSSGAGAVGILGLIGALAIGLRRRSTFLAAGLLTLVFSLPAGAKADWPQNVKGWSQVKGDTFAVRYGPIHFDDDSITSIFGDSGNSMLMLEFGPTIYDLIEIKGSIGYFHGEGSRLSASGASSSQYDYLNLYPLSADLTARLDVLPEQPIVPFAGVGMDYFFWREIWEGSGGSGRQNVSGGKPGWHTTYGAHFLLDIFNVRRASKLAAVTGITDSYITVEYREQKIGEDQSGLRFTGDTLTFGLKFDY